MGFGSTTQTVPDFPLLSLQQTDLASIPHALCKIPYILFSFSHSCFSVLASPVLLGPSLLL